MKKVFITIALISFVVSVNSQNDKLDKAFNKVEKGVGQGLKEAKRISKELKKELAPVYKQIKADAKPVVDKIWEEATVVYDASEKYAVKAFDQVSKAKKQLDKDVKSGLITADEKLRREEKIKAVERALKNLNKFIKEDRKKLKKKAEEAVS